MLEAVVPDRLLDQLFDPQRGEGAYVGSLVVAGELLKYQEQILSKI